MQLLELCSVRQLAIHTLLRVMRHLHSLNMTSGLRAHLHRHHLHDNGLSMPGKAKEHVMTTMRTDGTENTQASACGLGCMVQ